MQFLAGQGVGRSGLISLSSLNGTNGFFITDFGEYSLNAADDINGDGYADMIIGAASNNYHSGSSSIIFGRPGLGSGGTVSLLSLNGTNGLQLNGESLKAATLSIRRVISMEMGVSIC